MTIGIIGANGQVGSEVVLALRLAGGVTVVPICRSERASAFLRRCGVTCRHGNVADPEQAPRLLARCDLVVDLSIPRGLPSENRAASRRLIETAVRYAPPGAAFVFASSINALGMGPRDRRLRHYVLARSAYAALKRYAERVAVRAGRRHERAVYVLRLGQVHGVLQSVSRSISRNWRGRTAHVPEGPSYAVFAVTIAQALVAIAAGRETPGVYMLVETPPWSWKEVLELHAHLTPCSGPVVEERAVTSSALRRVCGRLVDPLMRFAAAHAEEIAAHLLVRDHSLELRAEAMYRLRQARADLASTRSAPEFRPYRPYVGVPPGARLRSLSDSRASMWAQMQHIDRVVRSAVETPAIARELEPAI